jgi:hypothetical protein
MRPFTASLGRNGVNSRVTLCVAETRLARPNIQANLVFALVRRNRFRRGLDSLQSAPHGIGGCDGEIRR